MTRSLRAAATVCRRSRLTIAVMLLTAVGLGATAGAAPSRDGGEVRAFAVAYRHHVDRVESYATFEASVREQFDAQIAPHLATQRPNLVTYPEDQGLRASWPTWSVHGAHMPASSCAGERARRSPSPRSR